MDREVFISGNIEYIETYIKNIIENENITIYLNSRGGLCEDGLALYDFIKANKTKINKIIGYGSVLSIAIPILLASHNRVAYKHTRFLIHPVKTKTDMLEVHSVKHHVKNAEVLQENIKNIILEHTNNNFANIVNWVFENNETFYFGAKEALKYGVIKKIL